MERNPGVAPMRRRPVRTLSRSSWEYGLVRRVRCRSIRMGVLMTYRDAAGPMDGGVLADLPVLAHARTEARLGPGAAGSKPQWLSDQPAGFRAQVHQAAS